jgi:hypothetical protein
VSNSFTMEEWTPDEQFTVENGCESWCTALFWIVPAKVEGAWQFPQGLLTLKQDFQMVSGTLSSGNRATPIADGRLRGAEITFTAGAETYTGRVAAGAMAGTVKSGTSSRAWTATRVVKQVK